MVKADPARSLQQRALVREAVQDRRTVTAPTLILPKPQSSTTFLWLGYSRQPRARVTASLILRCLSATLSLFSLCVFLCVRVCVRELSPCLVSDVFVCVLLCVCDLCACV